MSDEPTPDGDRRTPPLGLVEPIIEAAEQAAVAIVAEGEARAARHLEEARLRGEEAATEQARVVSGLVEALIERAEAVGSQTDELLLALERARRGLVAALEAAQGRDGPA